MIYLFTDFGSADIYAGQVHAELARLAPHVPAIDLTHDAPAFDVTASAHLLAALAVRMAPESVTLAVVDPGVGTERRPVVARCANAWFVGPDNGLLSVLAARSAASEVWEITWRPERMSRSFHGRDLFAPVAARIAGGGFPAADLSPVEGMETNLDPADLPQVIYVDHYGNAVTGLRALPESAVLSVRGREARHAGIFGTAGEALFWYVNSIGLVEIALSRASAARAAGIEVGDAVSRIA